MMDAADGGPARILVVEDSVTQALNIRHMLERRGFSVDVAGSAEAALESLGRRVPDLVIADYHLPGMNGDELARQLRMNVHTRALPVLMLTEARERDLERRGLESGVDAYVGKSSDEELIVLRMRALLRTRESTTSAEADPADASAFRRARILLVEGPGLDPDRLGATLGRQAYEVARAAGPDAALADLQERGADCVVVDLTGAGSEGIALCRRLSALRSDAEAQGLALPFVVVGIGGTEGDERTLLDSAFAAGVDDLVPASRDPEVAGLRIRALVRRKLLQDENRRIDVENRARELAVARARAEAAAAEARATVAEALAETNRELENAYERLKETQGQLVQAAKMASLGELVAGIAHEINNPLAFLLAHQQTVERIVEETVAIEGLYPAAVARLHKARSRLESMRLGMQRIQDLVLNLRSFSRLDSAHHQTVDVPSAIDAVLALLAHKLRDRIAVETRLDAPAELVCSPALFNQVVMNIVGNAADAIEGQGRILIHTRLRDGDYAIEIGDSGPGIPADLCDRIFDPFFTTKPVGSGTGLGLSIAYGVVKAHGGDISVGRSLDGGALFSMRIPQGAAA